MSEESGYNPLDIENLADSVATALLREEPEPLSDLERFVGAGIYALYYTGNNPVYEVVARGNADGRWSVPIYTGKAVPAGARKGKGSGTAGTVLYSRINEHRGSIDVASNLDVRDFYYRKLVVEGLWIPLGESMLIRRYGPVWNAVVDGFGNHDPGQGRHKGVCPRWDVLHPGREWAARLAPRPEPATAIEAEIREYLAQRLDQ